MSIEQLQHTYDVKNKVNEVIGEVNVSKAFSSVAEMKAADWLVSGNLVSTKGYYTPGDGGQASYLIKTSSEFGRTPDEYGNHTLVNGNVAVLQVGSAANVRQFGAKGDGITDATASIQEAIASITGNIFLPQGNYLVSNTLRVTGFNKALVGAGIRRSVLTFTDTFDGSCIEFTTSNPLANSLVSGNGISNITLSGNGSSRSGRWAINVHKQEAFQLDNVRWGGFSYGLRIAGGQLNSFRKFWGFGSGRASDAVLEDSTHLLLESAANTVGTQSCYTNNIYDFVLSGSRSKNINDVITLKNTDGLNMGRGYVGFGKRSLLRAVPSPGHPLTASMITDVYFDGVHPTTGTGNGLYFDPVQHGQITLSFTSCYFGNYTNKIIACPGTTNIRNLSFDNCILSTATNSIGELLGQGSSTQGSKYRFTGCSIRGSAGKLLISGAQSVVVSGTTFDYITDAAASLELNGTIRQKQISVNFSNCTSGLVDNSTGENSSPTYEWLESGIFTPSINIGNTDVSAASHTSQSGSFQRVGKMVTFRLYVGISTKEGLTGDISVSGLPFLASNTAPVSIRPINTNIDSNGLYGDIVGLTSRVRLSKSSAVSSSAVPLVDADVFGVFGINVAGSYLIN